MYLEATDLEGTRGVSARDLGSQVLLGDTGFGCICRLRCIRGVSAHMAFGFPSAAL